MSTHYDRLETRHPAQREKALMAAIVEHVQHAKNVSLIATLRKMTSEGATIEQELVINCGSLAELPSYRDFKRMVLAKHEKLVKLVRNISMYCETQICPVTQFFGGIISQ